MWKIRDVKRDARKAVWGNLLWCMIIALLMCTASQAESLFKAIKNDHKTWGMMYVFADENMKNQNIWFDLYLMEVRQTVDKVEVDANVHYEPSALGAKLLKLKERFRKLAPIETINVEEMDPDVYEFFYKHYEESAEPYKPGFPRTSIWGIMPIRSAFSMDDFNTIIAVIVLYVIWFICCLWEYWFFLETAKGNRPDLFEIKDMIAENGKAIGIYLYTILTVFLWTLLMIIPGILKGMQYMLVPYLVKDQPRLDAKEAMRKSRQLMQGHKLRAFLLGLSYLPWVLLWFPIWYCTRWLFGQAAAIIFSILFEIIFVYPYVKAAYARLYLELSKGELEEDEEGGIYNGIS